MKKLHDEIKKELQDLQIKSIRAYFGVSKFTEKDQKRYEYLIKLEFELRRNLI